MEKCSAHQCNEKVYCNGWMKYSYCRGHLCDGSNLCDNVKSSSSQYCPDCILEQNNKSTKKKNWILCSGPEDDDRWNDIEYFIEAGNLCGMQSMINALKYHHTTSKLPGVKDSVLDIKEHNPGCFKTVGFYGVGEDQMPISVDFWWYFINGHKVVFYFPGSVLVHWDVVENWLKTNFVQFKENHSTDVYKLYKFAIRD